MTCYSNLKLHWKFGNYGKQSNKKGKLRGIKMTLEYLEPHHEQIIEHWYSISKASFYYLIVISSDFLGRKDLGIWEWIIEVSSSRLDKLFVTIQNSSSRAKDIIHVIFNNNWVCLRAFKMDHRNITVCGPNPRLCHWLGNTNTKFINLSTWCLVR